MNQEYTAIMKEVKGNWIGWIEEIPGVNCQENSRKELLKTLRVTLKEALEFNREEARSVAGDSFVKEQITL